MYGLTSLFLGLALAQNPSFETFQKDVQPVLQKYCIGCHGGDNPRAGLALDIYKDQGAVLKDREGFALIAERLVAREMPPRNRPQPTDAERNAVLSFIRVAFPQLDVE